MVFNYISQLDSKLANEFKKEACVSEELSSESSPSIGDVVKYFKKKEVLVGNDEGNDEGNDDGPNIDVIEEVHQRMFLQNPSYVHENYLKQAFSQFVKVGPNVKLATFDGSVTLLNRNLLIFYSPLLRNLLTNNGRQVDEEEIIILPESSLATLKSLGNVFSEGVTDFTPVQEIKDVANVLGINIDNFEYAEKLVLRSNNNEGDVAETEETRRKSHVEGGDVGVSNAGREKPNDTEEGIAESTDLEVIIKSEPVEVKTEPCDDLITETLEELSGYFSKNSGRPRSSGGSDAKEAEKPTDSHSRGIKRTSSSVKEDFAKKIRGANKLKEVSEIESENGVSKPKDKDVLSLENSKKVDSGVFTKKVGSGVFIRSSEFLQGTTIQHNADTYRDIQGNPNRTLADSSGQGMMSQSPATHAGQIMMSQSPATHAGQGMMSQSPVTHAGQGMMSQSPATHAGQGMMSQSPVTHALINPYLKNLSPQQQFHSQSQQHQSQLAFHQQQQQQDQYVSFPQQHQLHHILSSNQQHYNNSVNPQQNQTQLIQPILQQNQDQHSNHEQMQPLLVHQQQILMQQQNQHFQAPPHHSTQQQHIQPPHHHSSMYLQQTEYRQNQFQHDQASVKTHPPVKRSGGTRWGPPSSSSSGSLSSPRQPPSCFKCGKPGHFARNCWD